MNNGPVADVCANCGAPLELDASGRCRFCHVPVRVAPPPSPRVAYFGDQASLVPPDVDDCATSAPLLYLTLTTLGPGLSIEPAVQEFIRREPGLYQQIRTLSTAVSEAGVRVRDAGLLKDSFDDNLKVYTPGEIWTFDLAIDVIAMLGTLGGLPRAAHARVVSNLQSLDKSAHSHTWKKELKKAGPGPQAFGELRGTVPRRTLQPAR